MSNVENGKVAISCDHNAEHYYSSEFDEHMKEHRFKRCARCHQKIKGYVSKTEMMKDNTTINRSKRL